MNQNQEERLVRLLQERILILDGAMGTMIQQQKLVESDFRGKRFAEHPLLLKGCNDVLCLTQPHIIEAIHRQYLEAGADIIETNTFNANAISLADYGLAAHAYEINVAAARLAQQTVGSFISQSSLSRPAFVAGAIGPTNKMASLPADVNDPASRAITFDELVTAYSEQIAGLIDGGVDMLLIETVFDTLNAKAALFAILTLFEQRQTRLPIVVSATISDQSGRTLSGQTPTAFWYSIEHAAPLCVGLNCALGAEQLRPYVEELAAAADCFISCYPNAGLPNELGQYEQSPEQMAALMADMARQGLVNVVGGCCGTTPKHIACLAEVLKPFKPRIAPRFHRTEEAVPAPVSYPKPTPSA